MSRVAVVNEIFRGAATTTSKKLAGARSTIVGARVLAGRFGVARRILQHVVEVAGACGFAGLEWNGQPLWAVSVVVVTARSAQ